MKGSMTIITLLLIAASAFAQAPRAPIQDSVAAVAPHLPAIVRYDGVGAEFHGDKYSYKRECQASVAQWAKDYPEEVAKFKDVAGAYINGANVETLSSSEAEVYYDLKAQWYMVIQL